MKNSKSDNSVSGAEKTRRRGSHAAAPAKPVKEKAPRPEKAPKPDKAEQEAKKAARAQEKAAKKEEKAQKAAEKKEARKKSAKKLVIVFSILLSVLILLSAGIASAGYRITNSPVNLPHVYIGGIFVGNMTQEETLAALDAAEWEDNAALALRATLPANTSFKVDARDAGAVFTREEAAVAAYRYGHDGNWLSNLAVYLKNMIDPVDVNEDGLALDQDYIRRRAESGIEKFKLNTAAGDAPYTVDQENEELCMVKGAGQMEIDLDALCARISEALISGIRELDYDHIDNTLVMPDFEAIHTELGREPQDAHFAEGGFDVVDEVIGCKFSVEEAESLWQAAQPGEEIAVPLDITYPEVTGADLRGMLYRDLLGSQTTYFGGSTAERIGNIALACSRFDGMILMPGEVFSYNDVVGQRTEEAGFKPADAYSNGEVVQEVGGGICQVSSTLYCASVYAQLETVERTNHYFKVSYLGYGMDATVSWGGPEFKFRNSRDFPVKLVAICDQQERALTIQIWGTDVDGSYVEMAHDTYGIFDDVYTNVGIGYAIQNYILRYDKDGNLIETIKGPYDIYHFHDYDINWPTEPEGSDEPDDEYVSPPAPADPAPAPAPAEPAPAPEPEPAPEPAPDPEPDPYV